MEARTFAKATLSWRIGIIGLVFACFLGSAAQADKLVTRIDVVNNPDRVIINARGDHALRLVPLQTVSGRYVGFQIPGRLSARGRLVGVHSGRICNVRYSNFRNNPAAVRIVANTTRALDYSTKWSSDRREVAITLWKAGVPRVREPKQTVKAITPAGIPAAMLEPVASTFPVQVASSGPAPVVKVMGAVEVLSNESGLQQLVAVAPVEETPKPRTVTRARFAQNIVSIPEPVKASAKNVSVNFLGADINDVLKALSVQSGKNIVSSKDVTGTITISLSDVTLEQALDYVAKLSGYSYARLDDTYVVGARDAVRSLADGKSDESTVEVVQVIYARVDDVIDFLKNEFPQMKFTKGNNDDAKDAKTGDKSKASARGGVIVLSGPTGMVEQAKKLALQIDDSMKKLMGETSSELYHVKYVDSRQLAATLMTTNPVTVIPAPTDGFDLLAPTSVKISGSGTGAAVQQVGEAAAKEEPRAQTLIITGPAASVIRAMKMADELDVRAPQIKIEAKVTSLTQAGEKKLGLSWDWSKLQFNESTTLNSHGQLDAAGKPLLNPTNMLIRNPMSLGATLEALINEGDGQLLAAPNIICIEGKPAVFFVGDEVRYIVMVQQTPTGQNVVTETANVGVQLRVVGDVSPDGYITLNLHPEVSVIKLQVDPETRVTLPIITRRFTDHVIRVKAGETIVIGGLIRDEDLKDLSKVPFLGDLPVLGQLFRHVHKTKSHSEVVMFITASIVND